VAAGNRSEEAMIETMFHDVRERIVRGDRRFGERNGHLTMDGVDLFLLGQQYPTPLFVYSEAEILRNISEITDAFKKHSNTRTFYAVKACSLMRVLRVVREAGIGAEANSLYEMRKCLDAGFPGSAIVYNGVLKAQEDLEFAIGNKLFWINVDSESEIGAISRVACEMGITANVALRVEPGVPCPTQEASIAGYNCKAGVDLKDAERLCRLIQDSRGLHLRGLHFHVGDQVPDASPFRAAARRVVEVAAQVEAALSVKFEILDVGGGIPVPYKYCGGDARQDNMLGGITSRDFAGAMLDEVRKWRDDVLLCIEPGRKVISSAGVLLTSIGSEKTKTIYNTDYDPIGVVNWKTVDAGYSVLGDSLHFDWFFYLLNARDVRSRYTERVKVAGPLCDAGDYFHQGVDGELFLMPQGTRPGDVLAFIDAGAYSIESQTTYNSRPRPAVLLIAQDGRVELIRRRESYEDAVRNDVW